MPASVPVELRLYDSSGLLVLKVSLSPASAILRDLTLSQDPWDPSTGPLQLQSGTWSHNFDGKDDQQVLIRNGVYLLVVESQGGSAQQKTLRIIGKGSGRVSLVLGPNPVLRHVRQAVISWSPMVIVELKIYALDGSLVRDLGTASVAPLTWDLRSHGGAPLAGGIYWLAARIPGERSPQFFKFRMER